MKMNAKTHAHVFIVNHLNHLYHLYPHFVYFLITLNKICFIIIVSITKYISPLLLSPLIPALNPHIPESLENNPLSIQNSYYSLFHGILGRLQYARKRTIS